MSRAGADLALLLLGGFRTLAERARAELVARGYPEVRAVHDFALQVILAGAGSTSEVGRGMSVTKQAAAKTVAALEEKGYVAREPDPADKRRQRLYVTAYGRAMLDEAETIFNQVRAEWEARVGSDRVAAMETLLRDVLDKHGGTPLELLAGDDPET
jgi:DNA-binding MarR family transcriptional regulator